MRLARVYRGFGEWTARSPIARPYIRRLAASNPEDFGRYALQQALWRVVGNVVRQRVEERRRKEVLSHIAEARKAMDRAFAESRAVLQRRADREAELVAVLQRVRSIALSEFGPATSAEINKVIAAALGEEAKPFGVAADG